MDSVAPVLTLLGESSVEHPMGVSYEDAGAQAVDRFDGEVAVLMSGEVDIQQAGYYEITYEAEDGSGNRSPAQTRLVQVVDMASYQSTFGIVYDGPIAHALVFHDLNGNGVRDRDEPVTQTNGDGRFFWSELGLDPPQAEMDQAIQKAYLIASGGVDVHSGTCLLYTSPSPRDRQKSRMPSSA